MYRRLFSRGGAGRSVTHDKPVFAQPYCQLEILAEEAGRGITERFVAGSEKIGSISDALNRYLDDDEGARALLKALHIQIEERMRSMAVTLDDPRSYGFDWMNVDPSAHPLDRFCAVSLEQLADGRQVGAELRSRGWPLELSIAGRISLRFKLFAASVLMATRATGIMILRGVRTVEPHRTTALMSNFWSADQFEQLAAAAAEAGFDKPGQMTILVERPQPLPGHGYEFVDPLHLKVPRTPWRRQVLFPTWRLALSMFRRAFDPDDRTVFAAFEALRISATALAVWPVAMNVRCETVSDVIDYLPAISVKSAIFRKFGAKLVRWPTTQIDTFGSLFSNLPHDIFVSSGNYLPEAFSGNWRNPAGGVAIGLIPADKRVANTARVDPSFLEKITRLHNDRKLLAYFGPSPETGVTPMIVSGLRAVIDVLNQNPDWFLVVKSKRRLVDREKGRTAYLDILTSLPEFADWHADERILFVDYADERQEVCPSGWLADIMDLGTGDHGSIVGECVARSRPYCSYAPAVYNTPFKKKLVEAELLVTDLDAFKRRLDAALKGDPPLLSADWSKWAFDPFQDDRALERLASVILNDGKTG